HGRSVAWVPAPPFQTRMARGVATDPRPHGTLVGRPLQLGEIGTQAREQSPGVDFDATDFPALAEPVQVLLAGCLPAGGGRGGTFSRRTLPEFLFPQPLGTGKERVGAAVGAIAAR